MLGTLIVKNTVRARFAAIERGDLEAVVSVFGDDAALLYPTHGTIQGKNAIRAFYRHFLETFPKVDVTVHHIGVENLFDLVGTNVVTAQWDIATTNRGGTTFRQTGIQLIEMTRARVTRMQYFFWDTENLRHAWKESE